MKKTSFLKNLSAIVLGTVMTAGAHSIYAEFNRWVPVLRSLNLPKQ